MTLHDRWFGLACAILAVPWTLIAASLYFEHFLPRAGSSPNLRLAIYVFAGLLNLWALMGMLL